MSGKRMGPAAYGTAVEADISLAEQRIDTTIDIADAKFHRTSAKLHHHRAQSRPVDFGRINHAALGRLSDILARWLPGGRIEGAEYVARNPKRNDRRPGSFKISLASG